MPVTLSTVDNTHRWWKYHCTAFPVLLVWTPRLHYILIIICCLFRSNPILETSWTVTLSLVWWVFYGYCIKIYRPKRFKVVIPDKRCLHSAELTRYMMDTSIQGPVKEKAKFARPPHRRLLIIQKVLCVLWKLKRVTRRFYYFFNIGSNR